MTCCRETADLNRVVNYLLLGHEANFYQTGRKPPNFIDRLTFIDKLISEKRGREVVKVIAEQEQTLDNLFRIYALVHCTSSEDLETKKAAYDAVPIVCPTAKDILAYVRFSQQLSLTKRSTGWGRAQRRTVAKWYNDKPAKQLAATCARFTSCRGWTHRDILRLAHVKPATKATAAVLVYINKGLDATLKDFDKDDDDTTEIIAYLRTIYALQHTKDEKEVAILLESHALHLEMVPTTMRKSPEVWRSLIPLIPLSKILLHLRRFAQLGFLNPNSIVYSAILDQLKDHSKLPSSDLHPVDVFLALKKYEDMGRNVAHTHPTPGTFRPAKRRLNTAVVDALHNMFTASLQKCVTPLHKRFLVTVDVRNPMVHSKVQGCPQLTPALASAIVILSLLHAEDELTVTAFSSHDLKVLALQKEMSLLEIAKRMRETPMGPVNCLKPLQWAKQNSKAFDAILILTDNQIKPADSRLASELFQYRAAVNLLNARLFVCALAARRVNGPNVDENGIIEIGGFDAHVPRVIANFVQAPVW